MRLKDCNVTIVGLGQMGASIGRAFVARRACRSVLGVARKKKTLLAAVDLHAAHFVTDKLSAACADADLVLLATPARTILRQLPVVAAAMKRGSVLIDVGSSKGAICRAAAKALHGAGVQFVGGHPMAGRSGCGPGSSDPDLFRGCPFVLCPIAGTRPDSLRLAAEVAAAVRARPVRLDPSAHDRAVSLVSHLPHVIAVALVLQAAGDRSGLALHLAAGSFLGATRVAATDTDMLLDILLTNSPEIVLSLVSFRRLLGMIESSIRRGDVAVLRRLLSKARSFRESMTSPVC